MGKRTAYITVYKRLKAMGYEYLSHNAANDTYTFKCSRCENTITCNRTHIDKEFTTNRWRLCSNCGFTNISLEQFVKECKLKNNTKSLISSIKQSKFYQNELKKLTSFLNEYTIDANVNERVYYLWNDLKKPVLCPYCGKIAKFAKTINEGYKTTCCSKECESKRISDLHTGETKISENRLNNFLKWQKSVTIVTDKVICEHFNYKTYLQYVTNPAILKYLDNRFPDSDSREETIERLQQNPVIEKKPICANPNCNNPVNWIGRERGLYTKYCSKKCSANSEETIKKRKQTNLENWGTEGVYDSEKYKAKEIREHGVPTVWLRPEVIEKRKKIMLERYGYESPTQNSDIIKKIKSTNIERYGCENPADSSIIQKKMIEKYGVPYPQQSEAVKEKKCQTTMEHYNVPYPIQNLDIRRKIMDTNLKKYGQPFFLQSEDFGKTIYDKFGVYSPFQAEEVKTKIRETNQKKYGVNYPTQNKEIMEKIQQTNIERYGVPYPMLLEENRLKSFEALRKNA